MKTRVTFEFDSVDEAIVALGKLAGTKPVLTPEQAAAAEKVVALEKARKGRNDKGKKRGPYGAHPQDAEKKEEISANTAENTPATKDIPAEPAKEGEVLPPEQPAIPSAADAQKALEELFNKRGIEVARDALSRFGCKRVSELKEGSRAEFIALVEKAIAEGVA